MMTLDNLQLFNGQKSVLFDSVGAEGVTILLAVMASLIKQGIPVFLVSPTETMKRFKMLLRKLNVPDLTLLEAQGKFKFSNQSSNAYDPKYFLVIHGASFLPIDNLVSLIDRPNTLLHVHKDLNDKLVTYLIRHVNLILDLCALPSGFSPQIFGRLSMYPGGQYSAVVKSAKSFNVIAADSSVTLVDA